jgi:hypothetical protein
MSPASWFYSPLPENSVCTFAFKDEPPLSVRAAEHLRTINAAAVMLDPRELFRRIYCSQSMRNGNRERLPAGMILLRSMHQSQVH